jgi:hypothetical protein
LKALSLSIFCALVTISSAAFAQGGDGAAAEALFQEAERLMTAKRYDEACAKFEESNRIDPGVGVLLHLADCHEKAGRLATAWATFQLAIPPARKGGQIDRAEVAAKRVAALAPRLPKLVLKSSSAPPPGLVVARNGSELSSASLGVPLPIDPGRHALTVRAPGYETATVELVAEEGKTIEVVLPALAKKPENGPEQRDAEPVRSPDGTPRAVEWGGQHTAGIVLAAAGLVGVGIGAGFGAKTLADWAEVEDRCDTSGPTIVCDAEGADRADAAATSGWISTAAFAAGGALLATGAIVFFTAPWLGGDESEVRVTALPVFGAGELGVLVQGTY